MNISGHIIRSTVPSVCYNLKTGDLLVDNLLLDSLTEQQFLQWTETDYVRQLVPLMDAIDLHLYKEMSNAQGGVL